MRVTYNYAHIISVHAIRVRMGRSMVGFLVVHYFVNVRDGDITVKLGQGYDQI